MIRRIDRKAFSDSVISMNIVRQCRNGHVVKTFALSMTLVMGMMALWLACFPSEVQADAPPPENPMDRTVDRSDDPTPEQRAQMLIETEILYRCVLWNTYRHVALLAERWEELAYISKVLAEAEEVDRASLFERYKEVIFAVAADTPAQSGFAELRAQLAVPFDRFDWRGVQGMIDVTHAVLFLASQEEFGAFSRNESRLARENSAALQARVPDDCPSLPRRGTPTPF